LESVTSVDINDFSYFKSTGDIASSETVGNFIKLIGNNGVFSMSLAPLFNGLTPRDYLPGLSLGRYFSSVSIDMSKMKDPTFAGILPDATDLFWYDFADDKATQFYYIGTPRASVKPSIIPVNKFKPRDFIGVENKHVLFGEITDETLESVASVYEGVLSDKDGNCSGSIQLKVASPKNDIAKVTVTIQITVEKKVSVKGELNVESRVLEAVAKDGRKLSLEFGSDGVKGSFGAYEIDGARNFFSSKNKDEKSDAENALAPWLGTLNMKCPDGVFSITIAKKGKVTVKGTYNGAKVSVKAQALIGEDMICVPVMYSKKLVNLAFAIWLPIGGNNAEIVGLEDAVIGKAGTLVNGAKFNIEGDITELIPAAIEKIDGYGVLPDGESVSVSGKKWVVADGVKAAKVTYKKGELDIAEGKKGQQVIANASGLKLTYKSKDGSFTGSFTVYAIEKGKLKKHKATVTGVLIDGIGYGTAMIKKIGDWVVEIR
jgi:hypothetical protein